MKIILKEQIKILLGKQLREQRSKLPLKLQTVANGSKLSWQKIDAVEIGNTITWDVYQKLLNFYHKDVKIELIDKNE